MRRDNHLSEEGTYLVARIRGRKRRGRQARIGAPDAALTPVAGLAAVSELCERLGVIEALDAAVGPVKQRDRGFGAGQLLTGIASAQLAGEDFLVGLDRRRADVAGQQITPVPGLSSTTTAGLARRITAGQWQAVEAGLAAVTQRMLELLPTPRAAALTGGRSPSTWMPPTWRHPMRLSCQGSCSSRSPTVTSSWRAGMGRGSRSGGRRCRSRRSAAGRPGAARSWGHS